MGRVFAEDRPIEAVDIFITERCNLNCSYCFHPKTDSDLTEETGKRILEKLREAAPDHLSITFFGGEPTLNCKLILILANYARTLWPKKDNEDKCAFRLSTNGSIFDEEFYREYTAMGGKIQVSIDGDKITSEATRIGIDFDKTVENIHNIIKISPSTTCRMTFIPDNVGRLTENIVFLHQLGFRSVMHHAVIEASWNEELVKLYEYQLTQVYNYRRSVLKQGGKIEVYFIERALRILNGENAPELDYCGAGKNYVAVLSNGDVYSCHRAASSRKFKLGNLFSDSIPIIRGTFLELDKKKTGCSPNCHAVNTCHSCPFMHYQVNGNLMSPVTAYCYLCSVEDKLARAYLQTEINDRLERKIDTIANVLTSMDLELNATKDCIAGLLTLITKNKGEPIQQEIKDV